MTNGFKELDLVNRTSFCFINYTKAFDCLHHSELWKILKVMGLDAIILVFWILNFKPTFNSSLYFIESLFSSSSLSAIRVVSSAHLRLLIFLPAILIPACTSSSLAFHMMYPAYKLNKQGDNIQPWRTPFPIWNQTVVPCPVLTVASWPAYRFLRRQVRWSGYAQLFQNFLVCCNPHSQRLTEIEFFLELFFFFDDPVDFGNLISGSFWTSGSFRFTYGWSLTWRILSITLLAREMSEIVVFWTFFILVLLWDWNEN